VARKAVSRERQPFATTDGDASALQDQRPAVAREGFDLVHEACLAHAGIATDEGDHCVAGRGLGDDVAQRFELAPTPDELGARDSGGHDLHRTGGQLRSTAAQRPGRRSIRRR